MEQSITDLNGEILQPVMQPDNAIVLTRGSFDTKKGASAKEQINIKQAINKYNIKLNELRRKMHNENAETPNLKFNHKKEEFYNLQTKNLNDEIKARVKSGDLSSINLYQPKMINEVFGNKNQMRKSSNKDGFVYKTFTMRNKFTDPTVISKNKNPDQQQQGPTDVVQQEKINKRVERKFAKATVQQNQQHKMGKDLLHLRTRKTKNPYESAQTIYSLLHKRKNEYIDEINKKTAETFFTKSKKTPFEVTKEDFFKTNEMTHFLEQKTRGEIPYIFPLNLLHDKKYNNASEKNRCQKLTSTFSRLKYLIESNPDNDNLLVKEFFMKNGIYEREFYSIDKILNFLNYIKSDIVIDPYKSVQQMIMEGVEYGAKDIDHVTELDNEGDYFIDNENNNDHNEQETNKKPKEKHLNNIEEENKEKNDHSPKKAIKKVVLQPIEKDRKSIHLNDNSDRESPKRIKNLGQTHTNFALRPLEKLGKNDRGKTSESISRGYPHFPNNKQPVIYNFNRLDFTNSKFVIQNIEHDFKKMKVIKNEPGLSGSDSSEELGEDFDSKMRNLVNCSQKNIKRLKKKQKMKFNENLDKIKKKNKLLDYIILQRTKNKYLLEEEEKK